MFVEGFKSISPDNSEGLDRRVFVVTKCYFSFVRVSFQEACVHLPSSTEFIL